MTGEHELNSILHQTVFIVDDDPAICESLCNLVESAGLVSQQFGSAEEFLEICSPEMAGCLVLDVRLPGMSGMELQNKLVKSGLTIPIIIMTGHGDIPMVRNALKTGAIEFLTKPFQDKELLTSIEQAFVLDRSERSAKSMERSLYERWRTLSGRERQVLEMVTAGLLNKQIADRLNLSLITVKMYRRQVMDKMQAETFADLVKMWEKMKKPDAKPSR